MKKILAGIATIAVVFILVGCGSNKNNEAKGENNKILKVGQEAFIKDNGKDIYSIKIDSIKKANDFEYKDDLKNAKEIVEVTYTYKNIAKKDSDLFIHGGDLQVVDENGTVAEANDMFPKGKPQEIGTGLNCTVNAYYGLNNESKNIKIIFKSTEYNEKVEFEGAIE